MATNPASLRLDDSLACQTAAGPLPESNSRRDELHGFQLFRPFWKLGDSFNSSLQGLCPIGSTQCAADWKIGDTAGLETCALRSAGRAALAVAMVNNSEKESLNMNRASRDRMLDATTAGQLPGQL